MLENEITSYNSDKVHKHEKAIDDAQDEFVRKRIAAEVDWVVREKGPENAIACANYYLRQDYTRPNLSKHAGLKDNHVNNVTDAKKVITKEYEFDWDDWYIDEYIMYGSTKKR